MLTRFFRGSAAAALRDCLELASIRGLEWLGTVIQYHTIRENGGYSNLNLARVVS